jgi:hypothetical protein
MQYDDNVGTYTCGNAYFGPRWTPKTGH